MIAMGSQWLIKTLPETTALLVYHIPTGKSFFKNGAVIRQP